MESAVPMDRLICGDVGYGKTEIAVRAAFKAVQDGKQVAILVPTTLLVQQHCQHLRRAVRRLPRHGARRCPASRPTRRPRRSSTAWPTARVDVVIGTHRLLSARRCGSRTSAWSSSTRSSASASSTRSSSRRCAPRRRAGDVGDPDPAHAGDGGHRHPRDVDARNPAGGAAPGAHLRRRLRREADHRGDPARAAARGPGLLRPQQGRVDRAGRGAAARARARGPHRGGPRADGRAQARAGHRRLLGEAVRRARLHHDRRDRPRHLQRQHPDRRAGRRARPLPAAPAARPGRPWPRARLRLLPLPAGEAAHRDGARPAADHRAATPTSARACRWR